MKEQILPFLYKLLLSLLIFLTPIKELILAIGVLLVIDFILGIVVAKRKGIAIQSKEAKRTIIKMLLYQLTVLTAFILDKYFIPGNIIVRVAAMAIGLVEGKSIFEHIYTLTGLDVWTLLKEKIKTAVSSNTKDIINSPKEDDKENK
jgi:phage-related holin